MSSLSGSTDLSLILKPLELELEIMNSRWIQNHYFLAPPIAQGVLKMAAIDLHHSLTGVFTAMPTVVRLSLPLHFNINLTCV